MRLLHGSEFHRHVADVANGCLRIDGALVQALQHDFEPFRIVARRVAGIDAEIFELDGRGATAEAHLEATVAQLIEHADLLDQPQRMMQRQRIDQRR